MRTPKGFFYNNSELLKIRTKLHWFEQARSNLVYTARLALRLNQLESSDGRRERYKRAID